MRPQLLTETDIMENLKLLDNWKLNENFIEKTFTFKDFVTAVEFIGDLVEPAESLNHHPDLQNTYNKITIKLTTHDQNGLTELDFQLAKQIDRLFKAYNG